MTVQLGSAAPDAESYVLAWLYPLAVQNAPAGVPAEKCLGSRRWIAGAPMPYYQVKHITGPDNAYDFSAQPVVSIHVFTGDYTQTARLAHELHRRMRVLIQDPTTDVVMADSSIVNAEWVETVEIPAEQDYGDTKIVRFVGRYRLSLHFV